MQNKLFIILLLLLMQAGAEASPVPISGIYGQKTDSKNSGNENLPLSLSCSLIVREQNEIKRSRIYLQDIAECSGSSTLCQNLLAIDLGASPKPGQDRQILEAEIRKYLDVELKKQKIEIYFPRRVKIQASSIQPDFSMVRDEIERNLHAIKDFYRFSVINMRLPVGVRLRHDNYKVEFLSWKNDLSIIRQNPRRSLVNIGIRLIDQDLGSSEFIDFNAQVSLKVEVEAAVAIHPAGRGELLDLKNIVFQWVPYQENTIRDPKDLERRLFRSALKSGQVLRSYDLLREPDVRRGEKVEASVLSAGVKLNSPAQAMESAVVGQRIRVRLDVSKRQVMATVVGPSRVEVQMP